MTVSADDNRDVTAPELGNARWYAVNTLSHREFRAKRQLENQGFRVFLPERLKTVRHARKLATSRHCFFPDISSSSWI